MNLKELFFKLLSFKSITPNDDRAIEFIKNYLNEFEVIEIEKNNVKNLFLYKINKKNDKHLCFAGHIDVVPPGNGWDSDPFTPLEKDGYIYARGTQDMKSGVAAFLYAIKNSFSKFDGTISALITSDEEGDAIYGTKYMLEILKEKNLLPKEAIVAEPTSEKEFGDAIKIGRRGSINGTLILYGKQGHAAYPEKTINPIHQIAPILPKIAGINLDEGDKYFAPSKIVITDIRSGMEVTNVTPDQLKLMFNIRNNTLTNKEKIESFFKDKFKNLNYSLELKQSSFPFITDENSHIVETIIKAIKEITNKTPKKSTAGGTSDARFFAQNNINVIEFGVINDTIHAKNERTKFEYVDKLYRIFKKVIEEY